jgi:hypothetical protein
LLDKLKRKKKEEEKEEKEEEEEACQGRICIYTVKRSDA